MPIPFNLGSETQARLNQVAEARSCSLEAILAEAIEEYLKRKEMPEHNFEDRHPSGKPWPRGNPVGGIITPV